jgi:hypothetical protein
VPLQLVGATSREHLDDRAAGDAEHRSGDGLGDGFGDIS